MKTVNITYIMTSDRYEPADASIDIQVTDDIAESLDKYQSVSPYVSYAGRRREIAKMLKTLAELQGYKDAEFVTAELLENE